MLLLGGSTFAVDDFITLILSLSLPSIGRKRDRRTVTKKKEKRKRVHCWRLVFSNALLHFERGKSKRVQRSFILTNYYSRRESGSWNYYKYNFFLNEYSTIIIHELLYRAFIRCVKTSMNFRSMQIKFQIDGDYTDRWYTSGQIVILR